jgi:hypothetical protein
MPLVASSVLTETKGLLNDPTGSIYPDQALIPLLQKAYRELQVKLTSYGVSTTKEVSDIIPVMIGMDSLSDGAGLPNDFLYPIELGEKARNSGDKFTPMSEREWDPDIKPGISLNYWVWREDTIHFVGATSDRDVMIRYIKALSPINDVTSPIYINDSETYLSQRTAALASLLLGHNPSRSQALMGDLMGAGGAWDDLKSVKVKRQQNIPVRRRRTRWRRP